MGKRIKKRRIIIVPAVPPPVGVSPVGVAPVGVTPVGVSCVLLDEPLLMADGTRKPQREARVGDIIQGGFGHKNRVLAIQRVRLGNRPLWLFNGELHNTDEHPMAMRVEQHDGWGVLSPEEYIARDFQEHATVIVDNDGRTESWFYEGLDPDSLWHLRKGVDLAVWNGKRVYLRLETLMPKRFPPETELQSLVVDGDHSMVVGERGYVLSAWARDDDFDYRTWSPIR